MNKPIVLCVDDEPNILKTLQRLFIDEDYDIHLAGSGPEAIGLLESGLRPSVIISDQRMPGMSGAEFLAKAREIAPDSIRMVLTGYADINAAINVINQGGVHRYIVKPWNDDDLKITVREAVGRFNLVQENRRLSEALKEKNIILGRINEELERKVEERTSELRQKVKELEGRDHIQQFLLTVHPQEELLQTVLEVLVNVCPASGAAFYLQKDEEPLPVLAAALDFDKKTQDDSSPLTIAISKISHGDEESQLIEQNNHFYGLVPVNKGEKRFGTLIVQRDASQPFDTSELHTIAAFGMQAAIGINDCRLQDSYEDIESSLDNVLSGLGE